MKQIKTWLNESTYTSPLSPGCKMCSDGSKLVILITGLCPSNCYYCPLSKEKLGKDRIFADEWELTDESDTEKIIMEAEYIDATGAGITGGDPLIVWQRTKKYITLLKERFGPDFHIHLYTSGLKNNNYIENLVSSGLDEIRFHPMPNQWNKMDSSPILNSVNNAIDTGVDVAIEIPSIPKMEKQIISLVKWGDKKSIKWINLNELEFSETNAEAINKKNFTVKDDISAAIKGSQDTAYNVINLASNVDLNIGVHYCSSSFKDGIQLKRRIIRRAKNIAKKPDIITKDGTLIKGVIYTNKKTITYLANLLLKDYKIKNYEIYINKEKNRIEINPVLLEKIAQNLKKIGLKCYIIEEYPTADRLEVERTPI